MALFDTERSKIGRKSSGGVRICDIMRVPQDGASATMIDIAVVAVPADSAQSVVNTAVQAGIRAILNFSPGTLKVPPGVKLKNVDLTVSLESLSFFLARGEAMQKRVRQRAEGSRQPPSGCRTWTRAARPDGRCRAAKPETVREAVADGEVRMNAAARRAIRSAHGEEGRSAADRAARRHHGGEAHGGPHSALPSAAADARRRRSPAAGRDGYRIRARVGTVGRTGVEMEALVAVAAAALTLYDMLKAVDRAMVIGSDSPARKTRRPERRLPAPLRPAPRCDRCRRDPRSSRLDDSVGSKSNGSPQRLPGDTITDARDPDERRRAFADADIAVRDAG